MIIYISVIHGFAQRSPSTIICTFRITWLAAMPLDRPWLSTIRYILRGDASNENVSFLSLPVTLLQPSGSCRQLQNLQDGPGPARNRRVIEAAGGPVLLIVRSPACHELASISCVRLKRLRLRSWFDRGVRQLGPELHLRQPGFYGFEYRLLPSKSPWKISCHYADLTGCCELRPINISSNL